MTEISVSQSSDVENKVIAAMKVHPKGITQKILEESIPSLSVLELVQILNKFSQQGKIELLKKGKQLVYALKDQSASKQPANTDIEEKLVYDALKRAGNKGCVPKDLKFACNLAIPHINKLLKSLEAKRLVKTVVGASKRKVFMLFGLEPCHSITGGTFYSGQDFDTEFVEVLGQHCYRYLLQAKGLAEKLPDAVSQKKASLKSSKEICDYIKSLKISNVELKLSDIENILESLIYDNKLEKCINLSSFESEAEKYYRVTKPLLSSAALMRMPCGACPVFRECGRGREVSPSTCVYLKEWLEL